MQHALSVDLEIEQDLEVISLVPHPPDHLQDPCHGATATQVAFRCGGGATEFHVRLCRSEIRTAEMQRDLLSNVTGIQDGVHTFSSAHNHRVPDLFCAEGFLCPLLRRSQPSEVRFHDGASLFQLVAQVLPGNAPSASGG